jgi:hypothetical protein
MRLTSTLLAFTLGAALALSAQTGPVIVTFDPPGSAFTEPVAVNNSGVVAGYYYDGANVSHAFTRSADGTFTTFSVPGASTNSGEGTFVGGMNSSGTLAGYYTDADQTFHGYLLTSAGELTVFDPPGSTATFVYSINANGEVVGRYDIGDLVEGFVRTSGGVISSVELAAFNWIVSVNGAGTFAGYCSNKPEAGVYAGLIRGNTGPTTTFQVPGATSTTPVSINDGGTITGSSNGPGTPASGFLRSPSGTFTTFEVPGATGTMPVGINAGGAVTGYYSTSSGPIPAFLRSAAGTIVTFSVPGAKSTEPLAINDSAEVTGIYVDDASGSFHGFLAIP